MQKFPTLNGDEVAIIRAEVATGHIYDKYFTLSTSEEQEVYTVFDNIQSAKEYIAMFIKSNKKFEFSIFDRNKKFIEIITPDQSNDHLHL